MMIEDRRGSNKFKLVLKDTTFELTQDRMVDLYADTEYKFIRIQPKERVYYN
jgi:hypothetical protein